MASRAPDKIHIIDLLLRCLVGVTDEERREKQDVNINITLEADLSSGCASDRIEDTVDYKAIKKRVIALLENSQFHLLERLAERIAEVCLDDTRVQRARVFVQKPGALRFARSVGVEIVRERCANSVRSSSAVVAYVAIGSNIDPERNIRRALRLLVCDTRVTGVSTFYRTAPLGRSDQPDYINGVCRIATTAPVRPLKFEVLRRIEEDLGRSHDSDKYAPRTIDLDLIIYGDAVIDEAGLRIPDPDIRTRPFVAAPLLELAPDLRLPDTGDALSSLDVSHDLDDMAPLVPFTEEMRTVVSEGL